MDYLRLKIPFTEFKNQCQYSLTQLDLLNHTSLLSGGAQAKLLELDKELCDFFASAFNQKINMFFGEYSKLTSNNPNRLTIRKKSINEYLKILEILDLTTDYSDELFFKRQNYTIKEKKNLVLYKLYHLRGTVNCSISLIYQGCGLKEDVLAEPLSIGESLENDGLIHYDALANSNGKARISLQGLEYMQQIDRKAFGLYNPEEELSEREKIDIRTILNDIKNELKSDIEKQFADQKEVIHTHISALNEVIQESIDLVDSKLPKTTLRQAIVGKIYDKSIEGGVTGVGELLWAKLKPVLYEEGNFLGLVAKAGKAIVPLLGSGN